MNIRHEWSKLGKGRWILYLYVDGDDVAPGWFQYCKAEYIEYLPEFINNNYIGEYRREILRYIKENL